MKPVGEGLEPLDGHGGARFIVIAKDQPQYEPLPSLVYPDGRVMTEWEPTEEERGRIAKGERVRLSVWMYPQPCGACGVTPRPTLQPVLVEITGEGE